MSETVAFAPRRLHPLAPVLDLVRLAPQLLIVLVVGGLSQLVLLPLILVVGGLVLGWRYLEWQRFTYAVEDGALVVESGLVQRNRRVVPLDRVQQVDVQRKVRHQMTGLAVVRIDTAGTGSTAEVVLDAVTREEADRLRGLLRGAPAATGAAVGPGAPGGPEWPVGAEWAGGTDGAGDGAGPMSVASAEGHPAAAGPEEPERVVAALGFGRLALAGITGSKLLVVFAAVGSAFGFVEELRQGTAVDAATDVVTGDARPGAALVAVLLVVAVPVWLGVAAGAAILADGGFRLVRRGAHLHLRRGLLDQREVTLAVQRVQVVRVEENALRRALGLASLSLHSAGGSGPVEGEDTRVTIPLLRRADVDAVLAEVLPHAPSLPGLAPAPPAARRRSWVQRVVPALLVAVPVAVLLPPVGLVALVLPVLAAGHGEMAYRALGWAEVDGHVVARQGGLGLVTALVPVAKAQSTRLRSSPFQRRAGLATLLVDVAGRVTTPAIHDGDAATLARLRHDALDTTAARRDERALRAQAAAHVRREVDRAEVAAEVAPG